MQIGYHDTSEIDEFNRSISKWPQEIRVRLDYLCRKIRLYPEYPDKNSSQDEFNRWGKSTRRRRTEICRMVLRYSGYDETQGVSAVVGRFICKKLERLAVRSDGKYNGDSSSREGVDRHLCMTMVRTS